MESTELIEIRQFKSIEEINTLRTEWKRLQWHPNTDIDFFIEIINQRDNVICPQVFAVYRGGSVKTILVGRVEIITLDCAIGYKMLYRPQIRSLTIAHGGLLGADEPDIANSLVICLFNVLKEDEIDCVQLNSMNIESSLFKSFKSIPHLSIRHPFIYKAPHYVTDLVPSIDEFLSRFSNDYRKNLRHYKRRIEKDFGQISTKLFQNEDEIQVFAETAETIACKTYQRGLGVGFINDKETQERLRFQARRGNLRGYITYVGSIPLAFQVAVSYNGTAFLGTIGYDPDFNKYSPGTIQLIDVIADLCQAGLQHLDWGLGHADYKKRLSSNYWIDGTEFIFSPTLRGIKINAIRSIIAALDMTAKGIIMKSKYLQKIKKIWRDKAKSKLPNERISQKPDIDNTNNTSKMS